MNYKRAINISVVTYLATIVVGSAISLAFGIRFDIMMPPPPAILLLSMVLATVFTALGAIWYFLSPRVTLGAGQGFAFGVIATITGFGLDGVLFVLLLMRGGKPFQFFHDAYHFWFFGFMLTITLLATTAIGAIKLGKRN